MSPVDAAKRVYRVLIIDDDDDDVFLLQRALDHARDDLNRKIEYERVANGLDALFLVSREDLTDRLPDALILDLNMPQLDGIRFLRSLRQSLLLKDLPVFVLTTTTSRSIHVEAIQAGANKLFVKPNDMTALSAIAREIIIGTIGARAS
jgi:two-component system chemotaxis response regulator CheY